MTIFDYINSVLFDKEKVDVTDEYNPYMLNRWLSMYSPDIAFIINETVNINQPIIEEDNYNYLFNLLPSRRKCRIAYIKKTKEKVEKADESDVDVKAKVQELSKREVLNNQELLKYLHAIRETSNGSP